jgi:sulfide dehydrogenase [flavocytochrome c] flavoprotein chain
MTRRILVNRRRMLRTAAAGAVLLACPAIAKAKPKVVVVGAGVGGATVAKYLRVDDDALDVTLIEANRSYAVPFVSNQYLAGLRSYESIEAGYQALAERGVTLVFDRVTSIDRDARQLRIAGGAQIPYDRLVLSPGIDFRWDTIPGYSPEVAEVMPHGYSGGNQFRLLKRRLDAVPDRGLVIITAPPSPYRCPTAPYERASLMAYALNKRGVKDPRIVILDAKDHFSLQTLFIDGWERHYPGMIEWQDPTIHGGIKAIDPTAMTVTTDFEIHRASLVNVIPPQIAGRLCRDSGLVDEGGFCPVNPASMISMLDRSIHVIGDSAMAGDIPKSGFAANSEAKLTAMAIRADLAGGQRTPMLLTNLCWSEITPGDAIKNGADYELHDGKLVTRDPFTSQLEESAQFRAEAAQQAAAWIDGMTSDIFG